MVVKCLRNYNLLVLSVWIMIVMLDNSQARVDDVACPEYVTTKVLIFCKISMQISNAKIESHTILTGVGEFYLVAWSIGHDESLTRIRCPVQFRGWPITTIWTTRVRRRKWDHLERERAHGVGTMAKERLDFKCTKKCSGNVHQRE